MRNVLLVTTVLSTGCFHVSNYPVCEEIDRVEVGDDEATPAGTAAELIGLVSLQTYLPARWWDGAEATARVVVASDGPAAWVEQQSATEKTRSFGFGSSTPSIFVSCPNHLELPLVADVASIDGALAVTADGVARLPDPEEAGGYEPGAPWVSLDGDFGAATFPDGEEDPADWDGKYAFVNLTYDTVGLVDGSAGWGGSRETEETNSAIAEYLLEFSDLPDSSPTTVN